MDCFPDFLNDRISEYSAKSILGSCSRSGSASAKVLMIFHVLSRYDMKAFGQANSKTVALAWIESDGNGNSWAEIRKRAAVLSR